MDQFPSHNEVDTLCREEVLFYLQMGGEVINDEEEDGRDLEQLREALHNRLWEFLM
jgi:hypothetical protein